MARPIVLLALLGGAALLVTPAVEAHGIQSTLDYLPTFGGSGRAGSLKLQSSFSNGDPARDAAVRLLPPDGGEAIELGHTGPDGRLTFTLPPTARSGWEIQVDAGPGHRDYLAPSDAEHVSSVEGSASHAGHQLLPPRSWALTGLALISGLVVLASRRGSRS